MRIMYIEDDCDIAEIYSEMIKDYFDDVELIHFESGLKAQQELRHNPEKYNLIISDYQLTNITGADVFSFVNGQMLGIPFIILSGLDCTTDPKLKNFFNSHLRNAILLKPVLIEELAHKINWCLSGETNLLKVYNNPTKNHDEKVPVRSDVFLKINTVPCNVFLKLNKGRMVKIINAHELFESTLIKKLILKGVVHFYVNRSELSAYGQNIINSLHGLLKSKKYKSDEFQKSQVTNKGIEILKGSLHKCGFNPSLLQITDDLADLQITIIKDSPELQKFLEKFQTFRKINTDHSRLVSYLIVGMLKELMWDSESTLHRMCTAALFYDFSLPEDFTYKVIHTKNIQELSDEEQRLYFNHPEESAHIARHFESIAPGIHQYILEHHELPGGDGFPKKLNHTNIHPLSATLHLAIHAADLLWKYDFDIVKVKSQLHLERQVYAKGLYRRPYEALMKSIEHCHN